MPSIKKTSSSDSTSSKGSNREAKSLDYYDYYDTNALKPRSGRFIGSASSLLGASSNTYGSYSSHYEDCDNGISIGLLVTALLGIGVLFFTLFTKITMAGRRKRSVREEIQGDTDPIRIVLDNVQDIVYGGNALFKIDFTMVCKIA